MTAPASAPAAPPLPSRRGPARGRGRFLLVCVLIAAAVGLLLYKGLLSSLDYFDTVDQALAHRASIGTSVIRLEGTVDQGTVVRTTEGRDFSISGTDGRRVQVQYSGAPPQLFQACIGVVVIGHFTTATSLDFVSSQLEVKHTASYVAQHPGRFHGACAES